MTTIRWVFIAITGLVLNVAWMAQGQEPVRTWVSRDQQDCVQASFVDYDSRAKLVTLKTAAGPTIEVNWRDLSRADQRYVRSARNSLDPSDPPAAEKSNERAQRRGRRNPDTQRAFGIQWTPGIENALAKAGNERVSEQQPVMWFRVLGQLDGFM